MTTMTSMRPRSICNLDFWGRNILGGRLYYYRHHIGDFNHATRHLTRTERLIYRDLLDTYYDTERALCADIERLARIAMIPKKDIPAMKNVLEEFFFLTPDGWSNKRCESEIEEFYKRGDQARANGRLGGRPKKQKITEEQKTEEVLNQNPEKTEPVNLGFENETQKKAIQNQNQNQNQNQSKRVGSSLSGRPDGPVFRILKFLNEKAGKNFQPVSANVKLIQARLKEASEEEIRMVVALKCREWKGKVTKDGQDMEKYLRPATLFCATNFAQYQGELPKQEATDAQSNEPVS